MSAWTFLTMPEIFADHQVINVATAGTRTQLAWKLDRAAPNLKKPVVSSCQALCSSQRLSLALLHCQVLSHSSARNCTDALGSKSVSPSWRSSPSGGRQRVAGFRPLHTSVRRFLRSHDSLESPFLDFRILPAHARLEHHARGNLTTDKITATELARLKIVVHKPGGVPVRSGDDGQVVRALFKKSTVFCIHVLVDASDDAPSRKEISCVLVRLLLRRTVKQFNATFNTHAKNKFNTLNSSQPHAR